SNIILFPKKIFILVVHCFIIILGFWGWIWLWGIIFRGRSFSHTLQGTVTFTFSITSFTSERSLLSRGVFSANQAFFKGGGVIPIFIIIIFRRNYWQFLWWGVFPSVSIYTFHRAKDFSLSFKIIIFDYSTINTFFLVFIAVFMFS